MFILPKKAAERKEWPLGTFLREYFPDAFAYLAHLSWKANEQHNPGQPMHWARDKSADQEDTMIRYFMEGGTVDSDGLLHTAKVAWRALAALQLELEELNSESENSGTAESCVDLGGDTGGVPELPPCDQWKVCHTFECREYRRKTGYDPRSECIYCLSEIVTVAHRS